MPAPKIKKQTERFQLAAAQPAQVFEKRITMDAGFQKVVGYALYENGNPGVPYRVSVKDDNFFYQHETNSQDYQADKTVPKSERFTPCDIDCAGNYVTVTVTTLAVTVTPLDFDFVFMLKNQ